ncbi:slit -like protein [Brachionus plicatilis]|uniref:Slit-like protein n=1 Tax=Brachionus plicatilis TaxID=10195 RepID=A0A3M7T8N3_BRAPC|nr:slit -like protein [Brachionus plicatilis]
MSFVLFAIFVGLLSQTAAGASCPIECVCQAFSADCSNRNLDHVPRNLPANILKIDLQGNKIRMIKYEDLSYLKSLRILELNNNRIETIERGSLDTMANLERLYNNFVIMKKLRKLKQIEKLLDMSCQFDEMDIKTLRVKFGLISKDKLFELIINFKMPFYSN